MPSPIWPRARGLWLAWCTCRIRRSCRHRRLPKYCELADVVRRRRAAVAGLGRLSVPRGNRALRVGLTGGIGSGKSTVAGLLAARDAHIVDADVIAREVVEPGTPGFDAIIAAFGAELLTADGALDRALLARLQ